jgi:hypothetical protein
LTILSDLAKHLGIEPAHQEQEEFFEEVVQKICGSLHTGRVVLIEFWGWDCLTHKPELLCWILRFWRELVNSVEAVSEANKYRGVKCIALVFVDSALPDGYIDKNNCCSIDTFERRKILRFSLEPWTKEDIKKWMVYCGLPGPQIDLIAERIYTNSWNGLPRVVEQELLKECCPALAG